MERKGQEKKNMKVFIEIDTEKNTLEKTLDFIRIIYQSKDKDNNNQTKILEPNTTPKPKVYRCNNPDCKKEITKDIVAFCLHEENRPRFNGKVYCRECQTKIGGDPA